jgi:hypothetical protein
LLALAILLVSAVFLSCSGGGGNDSGGNGQTTAPPKYPPIVFIADKDTDGTNELYVAFDDGTLIIKLSNQLVAGGNVAAFLVSPDGFFVGYVADQNTVGVFELFVVPVDKTPGETAVKVSGAMTGNGVLQLPSGAYVFGWSPAGTRVAYIADQNTAGAFELFTSTPDGKNNDVVSNLSLPLTDPGADVWDFAWEPNSTLIAYVADQDTDQEFELYVSPSDSNVGNLQVSDNLAPGAGGVREKPPANSGEFYFGWAPDSSLLAYIADQDTANTFELFSSTPDGVTKLKLSGPFLGIGQNVDDFAWAPNSGTVAYLADQDTAGIIELFTAVPNATQNNRKNTSGMGANSDVTAFNWAPNSSRIAFIANKVTTNFALYTVSPDNALDVLVSTNLLNSAVTAFRWAPDSSRIAYVSDDIVDGKSELFTTRPAAPLVTQISGNLVTGGDVSNAIEWAPNSSLIAYIADQITDDILELFTSTPDGSVNNIVSGPMVAGGDVDTFLWTADTSGVGYIADQISAMVDELFASQPDGDANTKLSGTLVNGGDVSSFDWVP